MSEISPEIIQYKIFGERHTATNAMNAFLKSNFHSHSAGFEFLGWKHRRAPSKVEWKKVNYKQTLFLFMVRNPYDWVLSMHRDPYCAHQPDLINLTFSNFVKHPIEDYENVLKMWNEKNEGYIRMCFDVPRGCIVRQEDLLKEPNQIYSKLKKYLLPKKTYYHNDKYRTGLGEIDMPLDSLLEQNACMPMSVLKMIEKTADRNIMAFLDYPFREITQESDKLDGARM